PRVLQRLRYRWTRSPRDVRRPAHELARGTASQDADGNDQHDVQHGEHDVRLNFGRAMRDPFPACPQRGRTLHADVTPEYIARASCAVLLRMVESRDSRDENTMEKGRSQPFYFK